MTRRTPPGRRPGNVADRPVTSALWVPEPSLRFAGSGVCSDPKVGVPLYGPRSFGAARHRAEVHVGFVGTGEGVTMGRRFYERCADGVPGDDTHAPFPGCDPERGYRCSLSFDDRLVEKITDAEHTSLVETKNRRDRFDMLLRILDERVGNLAGRDEPLDYLVIVLPDDLYRLCRSVDYTEKGNRVHRDLRLAFKAKAMRHKIPTQILLESTTREVESRRSLDHESEIAWNMFTGMYFKAGGLPWSPEGLVADTCLVGIGFFRPLGETSTLRTSVVQAFDENGDGLVLRGHNFKWDEIKQGKQPHLPAEEAAALVDKVLDAYKQFRKRAPRRIVVHKKSRYTPDERAGFRDALNGKVAEYDLVALGQTSRFRLVRAGRYPPLRGTVFRVGDNRYLYTTGYLPEEGGFPHGHVPSPLEITDHVGDTPTDDLLREVLLLTKMNWNTAETADAYPLTLRFAELVGGILREFGEGTPEPGYRYYM